MRGRGAGGWSAEGEDSSGAFRLRMVRWLAPCLCLVVVIVAVAWGALALKDGYDTGSPSNDQTVATERAGALNRGSDDSVSAEDDEEAGDAEGRATELAAQGDGHVTDGAVGATGLSSIDEVLAALDRWATKDEDAAGVLDAQGQSEASTSFTEEKGLVEAAGEVLRAYQSRGTARLCSAGYLDLKGNAWGALVKDGRGWVDIAVVHAQEGDSASTVRIVRMRATADVGGERNDEAADAS